MIEFLLDEEEGEDVYMIHLKVALEHSGTDFKN
jgi:hypothetical protein